MAGRIQQTQVPKIWSLADSKGGGTIKSDGDKQKTGTLKLWAWCVLVGHLVPRGSVKPQRSLEIRGKGHGLGTLQPFLQLHTPPSSLLDGYIFFCVVI